MREAIRQLETMLAPGNSSGVTINSMLLTSLLDGEKRRLFHLEEAEVAAVAEEHEKVMREAEIAAAVQHETALTAAEREQYAEFLGKEAFSKADFSKLEKFYGSAWDRLTEEGKANMSTRVWNGVRNGSYQFNELPEIVKEKEAQRLYDQLRDSTKRDAALDRIPENDRADFMREWEAKNKAKSYEVLDRPTFAPNVAISKTVEPAQPEAVRFYGATAASILGNSTVQRSDVSGKGTEFASAALALADVSLVSSDSAAQMPPQAGKAKESKAKGS